MQRGKKQKKKFVTMIRKWRQSVQFGGFGNKKITVPNGRAFVLYLSALAEAFSWSGH